MPKKPRPCKRCQAEISVERLEAVPGTALCMKCSQNVGGEFRYVYSEENMAKTGSFKKNYGGLSVQKQRKAETYDSAD